MSIYLAIPVMLCIISMGSGMLFMIIEDVCHSELAGRAAEVCLLVFGIAIAWMTLYAAVVFGIWAKNNH